MTNFEWYEKLLKNKHKIRDFYLERFDAIHADGQYNYYRFYLTKRGNLKCFQDRYNYRAVGNDLLFLFFLQGEDVPNQNGWWNQLIYEKGKVLSSAFQTAPNAYKLWLEYKEKRAKEEYQEILETVNMTIKQLEDMRRW